MKGIILYTSKYGATKTYATWLSEETGFPLMETAKATVNNIQPYDTIILGGGIYASGIAGLSFLRKNSNALKGKNILVFCDGASPYDEDAFQDIVRHNMKNDLGGIPCFYCRGAWNMDAMTFLDRNLCKLLRKSVAKKDPSEYEPWEKALMEAGNHTCDWTDKAYIAPILEELQRLRTA